jgi:hypothetical protein
LVSSPPIEWLVVEVKGGDKDVMGMAIEVIEASAADDDVPGSSDILLNFYVKCAVYFIPK